MKMKTKLRGFTLVELLVIVVICLVLATVLLPNLVRARSKARRLDCVSNLKQIGLAYRVWAGDNNDQYPFQSTNGLGWMAIASTTNAAQLLWTNYVLMAEELGCGPRFLVCPSDDRRAATILMTNQSTGIGNLNLSYFVGVGASDTYPQSLLSGDRNLGPGPNPADDYGYSPASGLGADVILSTNVDVCWSLKMHSDGNASGAGNILLGDGSVQQCSSPRFRTDFLLNAQDGGLWPSGCKNTNGTFRLIFP